jgi:hypothetical protein
MTRYDDAEMHPSTGMTKHPLAGVPQEALDAATAALREVMDYEQVLRSDSDLIEPIAHSVLQAGLTALENRRMSQTDDASLDDEAFDAILGPIYEHVVMSTQSAESKDGLASAIVASLTEAGIDFTRLERPAMTTEGEAEAKRDEPEPFRCIAEWRHGPGHQSITSCNRKDPHPMDDEHYVTQVVMDWTGPKTHYGDRW